MFDLQHDAF